MSVTMALRLLTGHNYSTGGEVKGRLTSSTIKLLTHTLTAPPQVASWFSSSPVAAPAGPASLPRRELPCRAPGSPVGGGCSTPGGEEEELLEHLTGPGSRYSPRRRPGGRLRLHTSIFVHNIGGIQVNLITN